MEAVECQKKKDGYRYTHLEGVLYGLDVVWQRGLLERDVERPELAALARELLLRGQAPHGLGHVGVLFDHEVVKLKPCTRITKQDTAKQ